MSKIRRDFIVVDEFWKTFIAKHGSTRTADTNCKITSNMDSVEIVENKNENEIPEEFIEKRSSSAKIPQDEAKSRFGCHRPECDQGLK